MFAELQDLLSFSLCPRPVIDWGCAVDWERADDPSKSKRYSVPYNIRLGNQTVTGIQEGYPPCWALICLQEVVSDCLCILGLVCFVLSSTYPSLIKQLLLTFFVLTSKFSCFILPLLFLCPAEGEGERAAVWCFAAGLAHSHSAAFVMCFSQRSQSSSSVTTASLLH